MCSTMIVIGGTACLGKTSYIKSRALYGIPTVKGEYADHYSRHDAWKELSNNAMVVVAYTAKIMNSQKPGHLHDRGPLDIMVYQGLQNIRNGESVETVLSSLKELCRLVLLDDMLYVVITSKAGEESKIVERMRVRNNGIDWLDEEYVILQNILFKAVAEYVGAVHVEYNCTETWLEMHQRLDQIIFPCILSKGSMTCILNGHQYTNDAGWDLRAVEETVLYPNKINKVKLEGTYLVKPQYVGRLCGRSSNINLGIGDVGGGVVDSGYKGSLCYACSSITKQVIPKGYPIAQMVLHKIEKPTYAAEDVITGVLTARGTAGFGSTTINKNK